MAKPISAKRSILVFAFLTTWIHSVHAAPATESDGHPLGSDGFIRDWLVLEPSVYQPAWPPGIEVLDGQPLANERALRPTDGQAATLNGSKLAWKSVAAEGGRFDMAKASGSDAVAATLMGYLHAYVISDADVPVARLSIGTKDMTVAYWNGTKVLRWNRHRAFAPDQSVVRIALKKGVNALTIKTLNGHGGPWALSVRLLDIADKPLSGIKISSDAAGKQATAPDAAGYFQSALILGAARYEHKPLALGQLDAQHLAGEPHLSPAVGRKEWQNGHGVVWRVVRTKDAFIDFNAFALQYQDIVGSEQLKSHEGALINGVTWAAIYVDAATEFRNVLLDLGANDHAKILVNDKEVARETSTGGLDRPHKKVRITLRKGRNLIALKVLNAAGKWQAQVGLFDDKGQPPAGLKLFLSRGEPDFSQKADLRAP